MLAPGQTTGSRNVPDSADATATSQGGESSASNQESGTPSEEQGGLFEKLRDPFSSAFRGSLEKSVGVQGFAKACGDSCGLLQQGGPDTDTGSLSMSADDDDDDQSRPSPDLRSNSLRMTLERSRPKAVPDSHSLSLKENGLNKRNQRIQSLSHPQGHE